jgi:hypothetical protein
VFALATPKSPTDRGREMEITIYLHGIFFTFPYHSLTPTRAECGIEPHSQSWLPNHGNGRKAVEAMWLVHCVTACHVGGTMAPACFSVVVALCVVL